MVEIYSPFTSPGIFRWLFNTGVIDMKCTVKGNKNHGT